MNPHARSIADRLSLRTPQRDSLALLDRLCELVPLAKNQDLAQALATVRSQLPHFEAFDRDFPSFCFALATGVGKTRLMGAFIAYLAKVHGVRHFFVLAPNLTIYRKLIADFTPGTPKYVFHGLAELSVQPPLLITGDDYATGRGVREEAATQRAFDYAIPTGIHVNVFNISKLNAESRGGNVPRIKRLSECIGESYFDYLAGLPDLVLLMDESHRYRASAGARAINELRPVLGLELTATPQVERGNATEPFRNVAYSYPLSAAMNDGFVKEPAVATRENFDANAMSEEALEILKLEDGIRIHEHTKAELEVYARQNNLPIVKPFLLVISRDTTHAEELRVRMEADAFFAGRYRGRVITVHSKQSGEEGDDVVEKLLTVEHADNPIEVVIHVNMLKEGWDVTNLYTIVPLRAAKSSTLVEQSIGRGLRLPYGRRTGVAAVDRLTIVAHDKFQEILDYAHQPNSILVKGIVLGRDIPLERAQPVVVESRVTDLARDRPAELRPIAQATLVALRRFETLPSARELSRPEIRAAVVAAVKEELQSATQLPLYAVDDAALASEVHETLTQFQRLTIDVPRIIVTPAEGTHVGFRDFDLVPPTSRLQPVPQEILIQHLHDFARHRLGAVADKAPEQRLDDYLVFALIDYDDISYDDHADLLYRLSGQMVDHLQSYLPNESDVVNVLISQNAQLAELIHAQMLAHYQDGSAGAAPVATVTKGFTTVGAQSFTAVDGARLHFRTQPPVLSRIGRHAFHGFARSLYPEVKFHSDSERKLAVILENEPGELKWLKPEKGHVRIDYGPDHAEYIPDFIVETATDKLLLEVKAGDALHTADVEAKRQAAQLWCQRATAHEIENGGKPLELRADPARVGRGEPDARGAGQAVPTELTPAGRAGQRARIREAAPRQDSRRGTWRRHGRPRRASSGSRFGPSRGRPGSPATPLAPTSSRSSSPRALASHRE
jgi:type III restriction enzyme